MVDMEKVFDEVSFNLEEKAKKKNIKLNFEIHQLENRPFFVVADFTLWYMMFSIIWFKCH